MAAMPKINSIPYCDTLPIQTIYHLAAKIPIAKMWIKQLGKIDVD
jgi:hypothetical protein